MRELQSSGDIRILILDDDPATCSVIQAALSNRDFVIDVVSDPSLVESALSRPNHYHLIILDYVLPGLEPDQVFALDPRQPAGREHRRRHRLPVGRQRPELPAGPDLRLPDQAVPGRSAPRDRLPLPGEQGPAADDRGGPPRSRSAAPSASAARRWA